MKPAKIILCAALGYVAGTFVNAQVRGGTAISAQPGKNFGDELANQTFLSVGGALVGGYLAWRHL